LAGQTQIFVCFEEQTVLGFPDVALAFIVVEAVIASGAKVVVGLHLPTVFVVGVLDTVSVAVQEETWQALHASILERVEQVAVLDVVLHATEVQVQVEAVEALVASIIGGRVFFAALYSVPIAKTLIIEEVVLFTDQTSIE
jgi:hypothetical protein